MPIVVYKELYQAAVTLKCDQGTNYLYQTSMYVTNQTALLSFKYYKNINFTYYKPGNLKWFDIMMDAKPAAV